MAASREEVASPRYAWKSALAWSMAPCARPRTPSMKLWYSSCICFTCSHHQPGPSADCSPLCLAPGRALMGLEQPAHHAQR